MKGIFIILFFVIYGCASTTKVKPDTLEDEITLIFLPYADEDNFVQDNKSNTLETILTKKKKSWISKDGQVIYLQPDDMDNSIHLTNKAIEIIKSFKQNSDIKKVSN